MRKKIKKIKDRDEDGCYGYINKFYECLEK